MRILMVEDDRKLCEAVCYQLEREGFTVDVCSDGDDGLRWIRQQAHDLVILDRMLPTMSGTTVLSRMRADGIATPVLIVTALDTVANRVEGLEAGADDYLVKPINVNELVLRINALLRRAQMVADRRQTLGTTTFEFDSFSVLTGGVQTVLPQKEFLLLYKLVSSPGHIFTRQQLMDDIWGIDTHTDPRTVDVHINRLRDRFRENQDFEIITVRGIGYKAERKHEEG